MIFLLMSPADYADEPQDYNNTNMNICEIMQPCCIPLRPQRHLRENNIQEGLINLSAGEYSHKRTQSICKEETPMSLADFADNRRQPQELHQPH